MNHKTLYACVKCLCMNGCTWRFHDFYMQHTWRTSMNIFYTRVNSHTVPYTLPLVCPLRVQSRKYSTHIHTPLSRRLTHCCAGIYYAGYAFIITYARARRMFHRMCAHLRVCCLLLRMAHFFARLPNRDTKTICERWTFCVYAGACKYEIYGNAGRMTRRHTGPPSGNTTLWPQLSAYTHMLYD